MAAVARILRLSVQTKVLIPVLACLVLLPLLTVWIVQLYITREQLNDGRKILATADGVFRQLLENRQEDYLARFRNALSTPRYTAQLLTATVRLGTKNAAVAENTIREFLSERLEDFGDDCEAMIFVSGDRAAPVGARRGSAFQPEDFARAATPIWTQALKGDATAGTISLDSAAFYVVSVPVMVSENERPLGDLAKGVRNGDAALQQLKKLTNTDIILLADKRVIGSTVPGPNPRLLQQIETQVVAGREAELPGSTSLLVTL